jgi:hypothetical protein
MVTQVQPLGGLTTFLRSALIANIAISLLAFPVNWLLDFILYDPAVSYDLIEGMLWAIWLVRLAFFAVALLALCLWTWRAWSNLHALGLPDLRFSPAYAVGAYFIPGLNLFLPLKAMRELYNRSTGEDAWQADYEVADATAWWGCTLTAAAVNLFLWFKDWFNENSLVLLVAHWAIELAMNFMGVFLIAGSAFFLFRLVGKIALAQQVLAAGGMPAENISLSEGIRLLASHARAAIWSAWCFAGLGVALTVALLAGAAGMFDPASRPPVWVGFLILGISLSYMLSLIVSIVLVARWIYRGHANLAAAGLFGLRYSPGWAVGWYFIPIANWFKPFGVMRELWNASHGATDHYDSASPATLKLWWACYIVPNLMTAISEVIARRNPEFARTDEWITMAASGVLIASALLLARLIAQITSAQRDYLIPGAVFA